MQAARGAARPNGMDRPASKHRPMLLDVPGARFRGRTQVVSCAPEATPFRVARPAAGPHGREAAPVTEAATL